MEEHDHGSLPRLPGGKVGKRSMLIVFPDLFAP